MYMQLYVSKLLCGLFCDPVCFVNYRSECIHSDCFFMHKSLYINQAPVNVTFGDIFLLSCLLILYSRNSYLYVDTSFG